MIEQILQYTEKAGTAISLFAVAVIIAGFTVAAWRYASRFRGLAHDQNFELFKVELGGALLLGLEILVLADLIESITVTPTYLSLVFFAAIVAIRTTVGWTLTLQTEGRWPWQSSRKDQGHA